MGRSQNHQGVNMSRSPKILTGHEETMTTITAKTSIFLKGTLARFAKLDRTVIIRQKKQAEKSVQQSSTSISSKSIRVGPCCGNSYRSGWKHGKTGWTQDARERSLLENGTEIDKREWHDDYVRNRLSWTSSEMCLQVSQVRGFTCKLYRRYRRAGKLIHRSNVIIVRSFTFAFVIV